MKEVLVEGVVVFVGTYEECVAHCKEWGLMVYTNFGWEFLYDVAIV